MRWPLTGLAWLGSAAVLGPACFFSAIALAGPHSSVLPAFLQTPVLLLAWAVFLAGPLWIARRVWRHLG